MVFRYCCLRIVVVVLRMCMCEGGERRRLGCCATAPPPHTHTHAGAQAALLREAARELVRSVRPDAVALVDAFAYPDYQVLLFWGARCAML